MARVKRTCNIYMKRCQRTQYNEKYKIPSANVSTKQCEKYGMRMVKPSHSVRRSVSSQVSSIKCKSNKITMKIKFQEYFLVCLRSCLVESELKNSSQSSLDRDYIKAFRCSQCVVTCTADLTVFNVCLIVNGCKCNVFCIL